VRLNPRGTLADGVLIQGLLRGRLFGIPILKINTTLVVSPAQIRSPITRTRSRHTPELPRASEFPRSSAVDAVNERRLAAAVKTIDEAAEQLAVSRQAWQAITERHGADSAGWHMQTLPLVPSPRTSTKSS
jgi:hypothetical protein